MTLTENFFKRVDSSGNSEGCWIWLGGKNKAGYGIFSLGKRDNKILAHHYFSKPPTGKICLHSCDKPSCVNPCHIRFGTNQDNANDKVNKNRQAKGQNVGLGKLTEKEVIEIQNSYASQNSLAVRFGVNQSQISRIKTNKTWRHVKTLTY